MRFDVKIQTSPDIQFRTTLTENLQADANLTLRGNPDHPGMIGRVTVTQGDVVFAGTKYTIDQGTVTFYNPQKIEPILNVDLETTVQGVDVALERLRSHRPDEALLSQRPAAAVHGNRLAARLRQSADVRPRPRGPHARRAAAELRAERRIHHPRARPLPTPCPAACSACSASAS